MFVVAGLAGSILVIHPLGILGMSINGNMPLGAAALLDLAYWPGDLIKTVIASVVAVAVHRAFPDLFAPAPRVTDSERTAAHIG